MLKKPIKIEDVGLEKFLDERYTDKGGYTEFIKRVKLGEPKTIIANAFGVNKGTIYGWLDVYEKESRVA